MATSVNRLLQPILSIVSTCLQNDQFLRKSVTFLTDEISLSKTVLDISITLMKNISQYFKKGPDDMFIVKFENFTPEVKM